MGAVASKSILVTKSPEKKRRATVEVDTDGNYILNVDKIEESPRVRTFEKFILDLKAIPNARQS